MSRRYEYVVVRCPPARELARGTLKECQYVRAVLEDLAQGDEPREYLVMRARQWDEEDAL